MGFLVPHVFDKYAGSMKDRAQNGNGRNRADTTNELQITYRGVVHPWQCDLMRHMNVVYYMSKFDEASWQFFADLGMNAEYFRATRCGLAALQQNITYVAELHAGDTVTIRSGVLEIRAKVVRFVHEMRNNANGAVAAYMIVTAAHFDTQKRKSHPFPDAIIRSAGKHFVQYDPEPRNNGGRVKGTNGRTGVKTNAMNGEDR